MTLRVPQAVLQIGSATTLSTSIVVMSRDTFLVMLFEVILTVAIITIAGTLFTRVTKKVALRAGVSKSVAKAVDQWIAILLVILGVAAVAGIIGISSEFTTLTISGIAGLAVSLALQTTLSNIIAGILMLQDGVLRLGDEIEFGSVKGEVVKLSLRTTWIKKSEGTLVIIGNSNLSAGPIVNYSAKTRLEKKLQT